MIPVQVPEELRRQLSLEFDRQRNLHNHYTGIYTAQVDHMKQLQADGGSEEDIAKLQEDIRKTQQEAEGAVVKMYLAEGGMNAMTYIINHEDFKLEPLSLESITRLEYIDGENEIVDESPTDEELSKWEEKEFIEYDFDDDDE